MRTTYDEANDILVLHLSDKPIVRECSQDWNTHVSYSEDGLQGQPWTFGPGGIGHGVRVTEWRSVLDDGRHFPK